MDAHPLLQTNASRLGTKARITRFSVTFGMGALSIIKTCNINSSYETIRI